MTSSIIANGRIEEINAGTTIHDYSSRSEISIIVTYRAIVHITYNLKNAIGAASC